ncbi:hypothetical protein AQUCO_01800118v1 [Aquilegia coerulea]|uniref:RING-type domain-containing protein n=1 Tax=Aquilegia coerulea TaxID=218851 RepID=A0A2G5DK42_AQUCA|nr:hypothetical protein AQUCO_01800118v1 [Aquilegia coerulea]
MQNMEEIDIDLIMVPDTPDRMPTQKINSGSNNVEEPCSSSVVGNSGISNLLDKGIRNRVRDHGKVNIDSANNRRLFPRSRGEIGTHGEIPPNNCPVINLGDSPSVSKNARLMKRMMSEKVSSQPRFKELITLSNDRAKVDGDTSSIAELLADGNRMQGKNKEKWNDLNSSTNMPSKNLCTGGRNLRKATLLQGNMNSDFDHGFYRSSSVGVDNGNGIPLRSDSKQNTEQFMSKSLPAVTLPRSSVHRRLVRNGCISPHNIAKAKCPAESPVKNSADPKQDDMVSVVSSSGPPPSQIHIVSPTSAENNTDRVKGKGIMEECSAETYVNGSHASNRISLKPTEEVNVADNDSGGAFRTSEGMGGWRSTRNRTNTTSLAFSDGIQHLSETNDGGVQSHEISDRVSFQHGGTTQAFTFRPETDKESGRHFGASKLGRKQRKRGSASSNSGECSTSNFEDSELAFLGSSGDPSNARSTRSRHNRNQVNMCPIIEIDEMPLEAQHGGSQHTTEMTNDDSDARARQLEADEMLARELQEQFFNESHGVGSGEIDVNIAWSLQQEEDEQRSASFRRQHVHPRDASMSHLYRQHHTEALPNSLIRSTSRATRGRGRAPTSARVGRLRDRFPGNSRTISSRERSVHFHPNIDIETRIHILETLEAAVGATHSRMPNNFFQRDFNENDYEMLLALDENNHQHVGANPTLINNLPQFVLQNENLEEDCAICLETPRIGDTIRNLPCLHKFHKDCIDPWLRRKTSCPVCKSGIT